MTFQCRAAPGEDTVALSGVEDVALPSCVGVSGNVESLLSNSFPNLSPTGDACS